MDQSMSLLAPIRTGRATLSQSTEPGLQDLSISDESVEIGNMPRSASVQRRFLVRPLVDPETTLDLTDAVIDAVARELGNAFGGNAVLNRLEAAAHLASLLGAAASSRANRRTGADSCGLRRPSQAVPLGLPLHIDGEQHAG